MYFVTINLGEHYLSTILKSLKDMKTQSEKALNQVSDYNKFQWRPNEESNNLSILIRHFAGNMKSRWTDIFNSDGEKSSRKRDSEFDETLEVDKELLMKDWNEGWEITLKTISELKNVDLMRTIYIRNEAHTLVEAINRQLLHYAAHFGQIMYLVKLIVDDSWQTLSIAKKKQ